MKKITKSIILSTVFVCPLDFAAEPESTFYLLEKIAELESRIEVLEGKNSQTPSTVLNSNISNWRRLQRGMTPTQVRSILGEPVKIDAGYIARWSYHPSGSFVNDAVVNFTDDRVSGWDEP